MDDRPLWLRERKGEKRVPPPGATPGRYSVWLPPSYVQTVAAEMAREREDVHVTTREHLASGGRVDQIAEGKFAVMDPDEREAKHGAPHYYADLTKGETPTFVVGAPGERWQDLKDVADEAKHYGLDHEVLRDSPDLDGAYIDAAEQAQSRRDGRITSSVTGGARLDRDAKPQYKD